MILRTSSLTLLSLVLFATSSRDQGVDLYVDAAAPPGYEYGTPVHPFHGIQDALDTAQPGDFVRVRPGIYYGVIELADQVKLVSEEGPWTTIIDGMGAGFAAAKSPPPLGENDVRNTQAYIEGFTIRNAGSYAL